LQADLILTQPFPVTLLESPLIQPTLLLQTSLVLDPPTLSLRFPRAKVVLPLPPGLFLATPPFVSLLIGYATALVLVTPLAILIGRLALLINAALVAVPLPVPLTLAITRLLFFYPALLFILPPLFFPTTLLILILSLVKNALPFILSSLLLELSLLVLVSTLVLSLAALPFSLPLLVVLPAL
jgi:hypothetical protein